jgi:hypothetical protein
VDDLQKLERDVQRLQGQVKGHQGLERRVNAKLAEFEKKLSGSTVSDLRKEVQLELRRITTNHHQTAVAVRSLENQVRVLVTGLRAAGQFGSADPDQWAADHQSSIDDVRKANLLRPALLTAERKAELNRRIDEAAKARHEFDDHLRRALKAAEALANHTATADSVWLRAGADWRASAKVVATIGPKLPAIAEDGARAHAELADALAADAASEAELRQGDEAWSAILADVRSRLREAVDSNRLLPAWFDSALGAGKPPRDYEHWLDTAARVVSHRWVFAVTDQQHALGARPAEPGLQQTLHDRLVSDCEARRG